MSGSERSRGDEIAGTVLLRMPNAMYRVELRDGRRVVCHVAPEMKMHVVHVLPGDRVTVVLSPYDVTRGRIIHRDK